jgi:hypothetical protein
MSDVDLVRVRATSIMVDEPAADSIPSVQVNRRGRRVKTDRVDVKMLLPR